MNKTVVGYLVFFVLITVGLALAQDREADVIYLKNGKTMIGQIKERIPDKSVVIETKDGIEIVDFSDIDRIDREFFPAISAIFPTSGETGTNVYITGTFPSVQKNARVYFNNSIIPIAAWKAEGITIKIPDGLQVGKYTVTVMIGNQKAAAKEFFTVLPKSDNTQQTVSEYSRKRETGDDYSGLGSAFMLAYTTPKGEFKQTGGGNSGFAKNGFGFGFEFRGRVSNNFYFPFGFAGYMNSIDLDAMNNALGGSITASSEDKFYFTTVMHLGLGFLIPFSDDFNLYVSGEGTIGYYVRPDLKFESGSTFSTNYESVSDWPVGFSYSAGIMLTNGTTFGYRYYSAKPNYTEKYTITGNTRTFETDREQPTDFGVFFIGISLGD